jgi:ATP-dependent RNA helicase DeaD
MQAFEQFKLSASTTHALKMMGFSAPTPVQEKAIPILQDGKDVIAQARTGTGKTAAFAIPMIEAIGKNPQPGARALILVPTRELCSQVSEQVAKIALETNIEVVAVYGGVGYGDQTNELRQNKPLIVVATPGRLLDHLNRRSARLENVAHLVLDEADRMLDMGFLPDVERILKALPKARQTSLFSATLPDEIRRLCQRFMNKPETVRIETGQAATPLTEQFRIDVTVPQKGVALTKLLQKEAPQQAIVFTRTKHLAKRLARSLSHEGHHAVSLQGNMTQGQRERALNDFRDGKAKILVATDIASRGLDVPDVSHVINYDLPMEPDAYVHRIGRTGRMGKSGRAFSFVQPDQGRDLFDVERASGVKMTPYDLGELPKPAPRLEHEGDKKLANRAYFERRGTGGQKSGGPRSQYGQRGGQRRNGGGGGFQRNGGGQRGYSNPTRRDNSNGGGQRSQNSYAAGSDSEARW